MIFYERNSSQWPALVYFSLRASGLSGPPSLNGSSLRPIIIHQPTLNETFKRLLSLSLSLSFSCPEYNGVTNVDI